MSIQLVEVLLGFIFGYILHVVVPGPGQAT